MEELTGFLEKYRATWEDVLAGGSSVSALASFFHVPCITIDPDGSVSWLDEAEKVNEFLQLRLDAFRGGGAVKPLVWGIETHTLGPHAAVMSLNWELRREDDSVERAYRICYSVAGASNGWKFLLLTYQSGL